VPSEFYSDILGLALLYRKEGFIEGLVATLKSARGCKTACLAAHALRLLVQMQHPLALRLSDVTSEATRVAQGMLAADPGSSHKPSQGMLAADPGSSHKPTGPGSVDISKLSYSHSACGSVPFIFLSSGDAGHFKSCIKQHPGGLSRQDPRGHRYGWPAEETSSDAGSCLSDDQDALRQVLTSLLRLLNVDERKADPPFFSEEVYHPPRLKADWSFRSSDHRSEWALPAETDSLMNNEGALMKGQGRGSTVMEDRVKNALSNDNEGSLAGLPSEGRTPAEGAHRPECVDGTEDTGGGFSLPVAAGAQTSSSRGQLRLTSPSPSSPGDSTYPVERKGAEVQPQVLPPEEAYSFEGGDNSSVFRDERLNANIRFISSIIQMVS
jgi:hypothetical protein